MNQVKPDVAAMDADAHYLPDSENPTEAQSKYLLSVTPTSVHNLEISASAEANSSQTSTNIVEPVAENHSAPSTSSSLDSETLRPSFLAASEEITERKVLGGNQQSTNSLIGQEEATPSASVDTHTECSDSKSDCYADPTLINCFFGMSRCSANQYVRNHKDLITLQKSAFATLRQLADSHTDKFNDQILFDCALRIAPEAISGKKTAWAKLKAGAKKLKSKAASLIKAKQQKLFGEKIEHVAAKYQMEKEFWFITPPIVEESVKYIRQHGLGVEGIFRKAGSKAKAMELRAKWSQHHFDYTPKSMPLDLTGYSVHVVADVLKQFLRELSEPLIPGKFRDAFMAATRFQHSSSDQIEWLGAVYSLLPLPNRHVLEPVLELLVDVAKSSQGTAGNKMSARNLAVVMAPNLVNIRTGSCGLFKSTTIDLQAESQANEQAVSLIELCIQWGHQVLLIPREMTRRYEKFHPALRKAPSSSSNDSAITKLSNESIATKFAEACIAGFIQGELVVMKARERCDSIDLATEVAEIDIDEFDSLPHLTENMAFNIETYEWQPFVMDEQVGKKGYREMSVNEFIKRHRDFDEAFNPK